MSKASIRDVWAFLSVLCFVILFFTASPATAGSLQSCKGMSPTGNKQCTVVPHNIGPWLYHIPGPLKATGDMDSESAALAKYKETLSNIQGYTLCSNISHEIGAFDVPWEDSGAIFHRKYDFRTLSTNQRRPIKFSWSRRNSNDNSPNACSPLTVSTHIYNKRTVSCADGWYPDDAPESAFCAKNEPYEDKSCPFGNPVLPALGIKIHTETDYQGVGAHPLTFTRLYRSSWPEGLSQDKQYWRYNWALRIVPIEGSPIRMVRLLRPDGSVRSFTAPGQPHLPWNPDPGFQDKLTEQQDGNKKTTGWTLRVFEDDSTETYDAQGKLLSVRQRNGWTMTLSYHPNNPNQLTTITNHFGRQLNLIYDEAGRLSQLLPPGAIAHLGPGNAASPIRYSYQEIASLGVNVPAANQLSSVTWQDGTVKRYHYENASFANALTGVTDEANTRIGTYLYNAKGQVAETSKTGGADRLVFTYSGTSTSLVDYSGPNNTGVNRSYSFVNLGGIARAGSLTSPCSLCGNTASYTTYGDGSPANGGPNAFNRIIRSRGHDQTITFYQYNAAGQEIEKAVFGNAYVYQTSRPALNLAKSVTSTQWHPSYNLPLLIAEPNRMTALTYDEQGNLTGKSELPTTDAIGALAFGAVQDVNQPVNASGYNYDPITQLMTLEIYTRDGVLRDKFIYQRGNNDNITKVTDNSGKFIQYTQYDAHGRITQGLTQFGIVFQNKFDPRGRQSKHTIGNEFIEWTYKPTGLMSSITSSSGVDVQISYLPNGQLEYVMQAGQQIYPQNQSPLLHPNSLLNLQSATVVPKKTLKFLDIFSASDPPPAQSGAICSGANTWGSLEGGVSGNVGLGGNSFNVGVFRNFSTTETCPYVSICPRIAVGLQGSVGGKFGLQRGPRCGKDLNGMSIQAVGDVVTPRGGTGGSIGVGSGCVSGLGLSGGPDWGLGFSFGVEFCWVTVNKDACKNTPCDCK